MLWIPVLVATGCSHQSNIHNAGHDPGSERIPPGVEMNFVFTSHSMMPAAEKELERLLRSTAPDLVLVEIPEESLRKREFSGSPREMVFAAQWAEANHKPFHGFDCDMDTKPEALSEERRLAFRKSFAEFAAKHGWRDGNQEAVAHELAVLDLPITDLNKMAVRENCMLQGILSFLPEHGQVVALTGMYHSDFFRRAVPGAKYPAQR